MDYPGNDLNAGGASGRVPGHLTETECRVWCLRNTACAGYTFVKTASGDNCAVKSSWSTGSGRSSTCCNSARINTGWSDCRKDGYSKFEKMGSGVCADASGNRVAYAGVNGIPEAECRERCERDPGCTGFNPATHGNACFNFYKSDLTVFTDWGPRHNRNNQQSIRGHDGTEGGICWRISERIEVIDTTGDGACDRLEGEHTCERCAQFKDRRTGEECVWVWENQKCWPVGWASSRWPYRTECDGIPWETIVEVSGRRLEITEDGLPEDLEQPEGLLPPPRR